MNDSLRSNPDALAEKVLAVVQPHVERARAEIAKIGTEAEPAVLRCKEVDGDTDKDPKPSVSSHFAENPFIEQSMFLAPEADFFNLSSEVITEITMALQESILQECDGIEDTSDALVFVRAAVSSFGDGIGRSYQLEDRQLGDMFYAITNVLLVRANKPRSVNMEVLKEVLGDSAGSKVSKTIEQVRTIVERGLGTTIPVAESEV